jgi:lysozyme
MKIGSVGLQLIMSFEGYRAKWYTCPAGKKTIGYGHVYRKGDIFESLTQPEAVQLLLADLVPVERDINNLVRVPINQFQFDALACFALNVGTDVDADTIPEGLGDSRLLKLLNEGNYQAAANEFLKWNKARINGKKVDVLGLTRRREAERELFVMQGVTQ